MTRRVRARNGATIEERLRLHMIEAPSGCWIWVGCRSERGYGRFQLDGKTEYAHRVSYETFAGAIPDGMQVDHLCRRPACIRPDHLQAVTPSVNVRRGTGPNARALRRDNCLQGHAYSKYGVVRNARRICAECNRIRSRAWQQARRAEREALAVAAEAAERQTAERAA